MAVSPLPVQDPASLQGLSLATILLAAGGNALMVPRALWTRDWVWLSGCMWGSLLFGWAQMLRCVGCDQSALGGSAPPDVLHHPTVTPRAALFVEHQSLLTPQALVSGN
jgi:hypothetical protein